MAIPQGCCLVAAGSIGRAETTSGSDVDFLVLAPYEGLATACGGLPDLFSDAVTRCGFKRPTAGGPFGGIVDLSRLRRNIGGDADTNDTVTHRMLLLFESTPILGEPAWEANVGALMDTYLRKGEIKGQRPPRFLLNDLVRFWRTVCVDYEGKLRHEGDHKWAIRNGKLRTVRKMLFAGGLFPLLECRRHSTDEIPAFLATRLRLPPADRVAAAAIEFGAVDAGAHALEAYAEFIEFLDDSERRRRLEELDYEARASSEDFQRVKRIGSRFHDGLTSLLFESELVDEARRYLVF